VGQEVEAQYDEDGLWYRAKITRFESANKIQVAFTEYGNLQWCGIGQLRPVVEYAEGMQVEARYDEDEKWVVICLCCSLFSPLALRGSFFRQHCLIIV
jgi:hypothetical protein